MSAEDDTRRGGATPIVAVAGVLVCTFLAVVNQTTVATALPTIVDDLGGWGSYTLYFTIYMLGLSASMPVYSALSDVYGRRPLMLLGIGTLAAGSLLGAAAWSPASLVAARALQGLGAGGMIPLALATIGDVVAPRDRGRWQGVTGAAVAVGSVAGPLVGGAITEAMGWRWVFALPFAIALACIVVVAWSLRGLRPHPAAPARPAYGAIALLAVASGAAILAAGGDAAPRELATPVAFAGIGAFVVHQRRATVPLIPRTLLRSRLVVCSLLAAAMLGAVMFVPVAFVPLLWQSLGRGTAGEAGLMLIPSMLGTVLGGAVAGHAIAATGRYRAVLAIGALLLVGGFAMLTVVDAAGPAGPIAAGLALAGVGVGTVMHNLVLVVQNALPGEILGLGTATTQMSRQTGGALGLSVVGALFHSVLGAQGSGAAGAALSAGAPRIGRDAVEALSAAGQTVFAAGAGLAVALLVVLLLIPELPLKTTTREPVPPDPGDAL